MSYRVINNNNDKKMKFISLFISIRFVCRMDLTYIWSRNERSPNFDGSSFFKKFLNVYKCVGAVSGDVTEFLFLNRGFDTLQLHSF